MKSRMLISNVLLVDDDKLINLLHSSRLQKMTSRPISVHYNGRTALEQIIKSDNNNFLVLLDLNMPEMDGWGFLEAVNKREISNLAVVVVSSSVNSRDKARALNCPKVIDYFEKPLLNEQLSKLAELIEKGNL